MLVVNAGTLIDGTGDQPRQRVRLIIDHDHIVDIVDQAASAVPDDADVIEAGEMTVMPGMIDAHVHVMWDGTDEEQQLGRWDALVSDLPGTRTLAAYANARRDLEAGFTTLRDMACLDFVDISLRDSIARGTVCGPRISACGHGLTATGGHMDRHNGLRPDVQVGNADNIVDTVDEARKAVRYLVRMNVNHIKVNAGRGYRIPGKKLFFAPEMNLDVLETICAEAHSAGRPVAAHSLGSMGEYWAVQAGVDSLEHAHFIDEKTIQLMAERGTVLVPTMTHCVRNTRELRQTLPKEHWEENLVLNAYDSMYRVIPRALELGVRIAAGTDAGAFGVPHGCNAMELEMLTTIGMSSMQAIVAATRTAAEALAMDHLVGTLEKGKLADLLIVQGDPLADVTLLQEAENIPAVIKGGQVVVRRGESVRIESRRKEA